MAGATARALPAPVLLPNGRRAHRNLGGIPVAFRAQRRCVDRPLIQRHTRRGRAVRVLGGGVRARRRARRRRRRAPAWAGAAQIHLRWTSCSRRRHPQLPYRWVSSDGSRA